MSSGNSDSSSGSSIVRCRCHELCEVLRGVTGVRRRPGSVVVPAAARPRPAAIVHGGPGSRRRHRVWQSRREHAGSQQSSRHGRGASACLGAAGDEDAHENHHKDVGDLHVASFISAFLALASASLYLHGRILPFW